MESRYPRQAWVGAAECCSVTSQLKIDSRLHMPQMSSICFLRPKKGGGIPRSKFIIAAVSVERSVITHDTTEKLS